MAGRDAPVITAGRAARYSSADHSEIELSFPFEGLPGHADNGKQQHAFYSPERYAEKQAEHSKDTYPDPEPFTDGKFKR